MRRVNSKTFLMSAFSKCNTEQCLLLHLNRLRSLLIILNIEAVPSEPGLNTKQKNELKAIADGCLNVLEKLKQTLDKYSELTSGSASVGSKAKRVWKRLRWEPEDIKELRSRISTNVSLLIAFNGQLTRNNIFTLVRHKEDQECQIVSNWLTPIDYADQQNDFISRRQAGTGQWLLDSPEFKTWLKASKKTLFCQGYPGVGKTFLTSTLIEYLQTDWQIDSSQNSSIQDSKIGVAFIYCDFKQRGQQKPVSILASLIKQLIQHQPRVPEAVKDLYERYKKKPPSSCSIPTLVISRQRCGMSSLIFILEFLSSSMRLTNVNIQRSS